MYKWSVAHENCTYISIISIIITINITTIDIISMSHLISHDVDHYKVKGTLYLPPSPVLNFTPFCSITIHFEVTGHCVSNAQNAQKLTLNSIKWHVTPPPHNMFCYYSSFANFNPFRSTASLFRATGHFEKIVPKDRKWPWTTYCSRIPESQVSFPFTLRPAVFVII